MWHAILVNDLTVSGDCYLDASKTVLQNCDLSVLLSYFVISYVVHNMETTWKITAKLNDEEIEA